LPFKIPNTGAPRSHLVLPDSHTYPKDNLRRYAALGNYIVEHQPEVIVNLGDFADMPSLSSYDKGKKEFVFQNVQDDIESLHAAEEVLYAPMHTYNRYQAKIKKKQYEPIIIKILGNHEARLSKLLEYEPRWASKTVNMDAFNTRQSINETVVPYMDWIEIDGVYYSHLWVSGVLGKAVPNAKAILTKKGVSATMGHTHILDSAQMTKPNGTRIRGLIAGCFQDPDHAGFGGTQVDKIYDNLIVHKHDVCEGDYDMSEVSIGRLLKDFL
jgi:hypothetical protein